MKKSIRLFSAAVLGAAAIACSSPEKMAEQAENVLVSCDPAVLEVKAGVIDANVTVTYPADYFHPKAILEVIPVIVYDGGEAKMESYFFQGTKVEDNYEVVPEEGATITKPVHFEYAEGMENCHLELRGVVKYKADKTDLPTKKVADGANTTYMLVKKDAKAAVDFKADNYQETIPMPVEGQILYTINSANVRNSEIKSQSIKDFQAALDEIAANERKTLTGTEVVAYASPDGGEELNTKLSDKRAKSAEKAFNKVTKGKETGETSVKSVGQDWEGFQELVAASDIEDKDLIIRVLSMYSDPAVRENEIKNMSAVYKTLADEVLPQLRRGRFIANCEYQNYTGEELIKLVDENIDVLDEEALLRAATLVKEPADKEAIYKKAVEKYNSNRAQYNLAVVYINEGKFEKADKALDKCEQDADWNNAKGVVALNTGDEAAASKYFAAAGNATAKANEAVVDILNGRYEAAAAKLAGQKSFNAALAQVLVKNYAAAEAALPECDCACVAYLKAVIAARQGKADAVKANLEAASKCEKLAKRAEKDIEFAQYR
ncbi:MAG: hypothetical protein MR588_00560 [Bacteroidales bacterium]|nr:hypothetical protein [Bacteroidales bacterium]MDD7532150.1 hypothetical protein [Bacteroidales bacterium]MDY5744341.1 hypothetical protein [Candidatus Cryptobacteroides sp.]